MDRNRLVQLSQLSLRIVTLRPHHPGTHLVLRRCLFEAGSRGVHVGHRRICRNQVVNLFARVPAATPRRERSSQHQYDQHSLLDPFHVCLPIDPGFPFCLSAANQSTTSCLRSRSFLHSFQRQIPGVPSGAASGTNSRHLPISGGEFMDTSAPTPFVVQIGLVWLPRLAGWPPLPPPAMSVDVKSLVPYRQCSACRTSRMPMLPVRSSVDTAICSKPLARWMYGD